VTISSYPKVSYPEKDDFFTILLTSAIIADNIYQQYHFGSDHS